MSDLPSNQTARGSAVIRRPDIQQLSSRFIRLADQSENPEQLIPDFLQTAIGLVNAAGAIYFTRNQDGSLAAEQQMLSRQALSWSSDLAGFMRQNSLRALNSGQVQVSALEQFPAARLISCPAGRGSSFTSCLSFIILTDNQSVESFLVIIQLLTALLFLCIERCGAREARRDSDQLKQLISVAALALEYRYQPEALLQFNSMLRSWAGCEQVAIGTMSASGKMTLSSLSHVTSVDQRSEQARIFTKALSECAIQQDILVYPPISTKLEQSSPLFREVLSFGSNSQAVGFSLADSRGTVTGAVIFLWERPEKRKELLSSLAAGRTVLTSCLAVMQEKPGSRFAGAIGIRGTGKPRRFSRYHLVLAVIVLLGAAGLIPLPFRLSAPGLVQPVSTRFVVARFDGILQDVLVLPGEEVQHGEIIAHLDGREVALTRAAVTAERNKARKTRDHYLASGNTAEAQIAGLEEQRLEQQLSLLVEQEKSLTLESPVDGIVLSGDLRRTLGSPVSKGQNLFEISPLESMIVELAVREDNISHVQPNMEARVRFDAYPDAAWQGEIKKINPKSVIRDNRNVFIAELEFDNSDGRLRPGMQGEAVIRTGSKPLGWIVFHKPWYTLLRLKDYLF